MAENTPPRGTCGTKLEPLNTLTVKGRVDLYCHTQTDNILGSYILKDIVKDNFSRLQLNPLPSLHFVGSERWLNAKLVTAKASKGSNVLLAASRQRTKIVRANYRLPGEHILSQIRVQLPISDTFHHPKERLINLFSS